MMADPLFKRAYKRSSERFFELPTVWKFERGPEGRNESTPPEQMKPNPRGTPRLIDSPNERKYRQILANRWTWFAVIVLAFLIAFAPFFQLWLAELWALSQPPN